jgi:hypothetical protein
MSKESISIASLSTEASLEDGSAAVLRDAHWKAGVPSQGEGSVADRSMLESRGWNSGDDEEAMNNLLMSYTREIMMAIDSIDDGNDLSENERLLMFKHISAIIKQDRIRVRPQNQKAV